MVEKLPKLLADGMDQLSKNCQKRKSIMMNQTWTAAAIIPNSQHIKKLGEIQEV